MNLASVKPVRVDPTGKPMTAPTHHTNLTHILSCTFGILVKTHPKSPAATPMPMPVAIYAMTIPTCTPGFPPRVLLNEIAMHTVKQKMQITSSKTPAAISDDGMPFFTPYFLSIILIIRGTTIEGLIQAMP